MPRILICSTPRVGSVAFAEKFSKLIQLPLAFQPWEPYAFNKQPDDVKAQTLSVIDAKDVVIHSHIHACIEKMNTMDMTIFIGRRDRIRQAWSFFIAYHVGKMQNLNLNSVTIPEPGRMIVDLFIEWINLWDRVSENQHKIFYEDLDLTNLKWQQCKYEMVSITNFEKIEARIKAECQFKIQ